MAAEISTIEIYVNELKALSHANINCRAPAWALGYPCLGGDGAIEVDALLHRIENYLSIDPNCRGLTFRTRLPAGDETGSYWVLEIQINFGDENAPPQWLLWAPAAKPLDVTLAGKGYDQPNEIARLVCGIVTHKGAVQVQ